VDRERWEAVESRRIPLRTDLETVVATFTATAESLGSEAYRVEAAAGSVRSRRDFRVEVIRQ